MPYWSKRVPSGDSTLRGVDLRHRYSEYFQFAWGSSSHEKTIPNTASFVGCCVPTAPFQFFPGLYLEAHTLCAFETAAEFFFDLFEKVLVGEDTFFPNSHFVGGVTDDQVDLASGEVVLGQ